MSEKLKATLTYSNKTVDMDDKSAAEALIKDMIIEKFPEFKGGKMVGVRIELKRIEGMNIKPKDGKYILSMEAYMPPGDVARLLYLSGQGVPVQAVIESPQAAFDLVVNEFNLMTGEVVHSKEPVAAGNLRE